MESVVFFALGLTLGVWAAEISRQERVGNPGHRAKGWWVLVFLGTVFVALMNAFH